MLKVFFLGLFLAFGTVVSQAQILSVTDSEKLIDYLKRDNVISALDLIRAKKLSNTPSRQLQEAEKILDRAKGFSQEYFQRIELRGDAARILGFHDVALVFYKNAIDRIEEWSQKFGGRRDSDFYNIAYKAAICSFWLKDYGGALFYLNYIEKNGDTWVKDFGRDKANLLREFIGSTDEVSTRIKFAKGFWISNVPAVGVQIADATAFFEETLEFNPTREETKQIFLLLLNAAQQREDIETAEVYLQKIVVAFPQEDFTFESVFAHSQLYFKNKKYTEAQKWLNWIIENSQPNGRFIPLAYLGLSEVSTKLGDESAMLRYLKLAAQNPNAVATNRSIMDTSDTRQVALVRLGKHYKEKGNYEEALKYFTEWQPRSWCGNEQAQVKYEKDLYIAECLIGLGREDEALEKYLMPHLKIDGGELYGDTHIPRLVVSFYEKKNALEDFLFFIKPHAANKYNYAAQIAEKLAQIKVDIKNGEIEKLVSEIKHSGGYVPNITQDFIRESNWKGVAIDEELAKMNGKEFPFLKKRYEELSLSKQENAFGDRVWIIYALGLSKSKESEIYLQELLQKAKSDNATATIGDIVFALSLKKGK